MTPPRNVSRDPASNTGAYVLNALDAAERAAFEEQLVGSETLRSEVTELSDTAVQLGLSVDPITPPADLKANLMALIGSTQQLPAQAQLPAEEQLPAEPLPAEQQLPSEQHADVPTELSAPLAAKVRSRWFSRPVMALTAAAAAVAIIVGGGLIANQLGSTTFVQQQASQLAAINSALDHKQAVAAVSTGGTATLVWSESLGKSALITDGLPALPTGKAYELWYIDAAGTPTPAGMLDAAAGSSTWRVLDGAMAPGDTVGVTVEPRSGSKAPTTTPIVAIPSA